MNQTILFNDDLQFDEQQDAWRFTALYSGLQIKIYFHSFQLKSLAKIDSCTKFDLEEIVELWFENHELEGDEIHINMR